MAKDCTWCSISSLLLPPLFWSSYFSVRVTIVNLILKQILEANSFILERGSVWRAESSNKMISSFSLQVWTPSSSESSASRAEGSRVHRELLRFCEETSHKCRLFVAAAQLWYQRGRVLRYQHASQSYSSSILPCKSSPFCLFFL